MVNIRGVDFLNTVDNVTNVPAVFMDHKSIHMFITTNDSGKNMSRSRYWILNNSLLLNNDFKREVLRIIEKYYKQSLITNMGCIGIL